MSFILRGPFLKSLQIPPVGLAQPRVFYYFFDGFILGNSKALDWAVIMKIGGQKGRIAGYRLGLKMLDI